jgi:hypothetical protein
MAKKHSPPEHRVAQGRVIRLATSVCNLEYRTPPKQLTHARVKAIDDTRFDNLSSTQSVRRTAPEEQCSAELDSSREPWERRFSVGFRINYRVAQEEVGYHIDCIAGSKRVFQLPGQFPNLSRSALTELSKELGAGKVKPLRQQRAPLDYLFLDRLPPLRVGFRSTRPAALLTALHLIAAQLLLSEHIDYHG